MNIYFPILTLDITTLRNPYLRTLIQGIKSITKDVEISLGIDLFWQPKCNNYDIIHIMWPEDLLLNNHTSIDVENRLKELKSFGVKIITTCHNFHAHVPKSEENNLVYKIVYNLSDATIHLGQISYDIFKQTYLNVEQVIIPHHVYDTLYPNLFSKQESCRKIGLPLKNRYILCMGAFRNDMEKQFVCNIARHLKGTNYYLLAPTFVERKKRRYLIRYVQFLCFILKMKIKYPRMIIKGQPVSDEELPYYYGASDLSLIHRLEILNSGNLPLAFYMGKTVIGPDTGNVASILKNTGNYTFDTQNPNSVVKVLDAALSTNLKEKGLRNRALAIKEWKTATIAQSVVNLYKQILNY